MPSRRCSTGRVSVGSSRPIRIAPRRSRRSDPPRRAGVGGHDDVPGSTSAANGSWRRGRPTGGPVDGLDRGPQRHDHRGTVIRPRRGRIRSPDPCRHRRRAARLIARVVATGRPRPRRRTSDQRSSRWRSAIAELEVETRSTRVRGTNPPRASGVGAQPSALGTDAAELAKGRRQQRSILSLDPARHPGLRPRQLTMPPAREIGGDFFELFRLRRRGRPLGIVIADVTGKGLDAALLMAFSRRGHAHRPRRGARTCRRPGANESRACRGAPGHALRHGAVRGARPADRADPDRQRGP